MGAFNEFMAEQPISETPEKGAFSQLMAETPQDQPQQEQIPPEYSVGKAPIMAQVGRGMMDVYQGAKQLALNVFAKKETADAYNQELADEVSLYNKNNPDFQFSRLAGSLATPLSLIPGATATTFGGRLVAGAVTGAAFSAATPVEGGDFFKEKGKQMGAGAVIGGAIPIVGAVGGKILSTLDELTKPLYQKGIKRDIAKFINEYITENKDLITKTLNKAVQSGDDRTVGQIISDAAAKNGDDFGGMITRLERDLSRESDAIKSIYARQSGSRRAFLESISGTEDDLAAAINKRATNGSMNYKSAFANPIKADSEIIKILDNKFAKTARKEAMDIAEAEGSTSTTEILHNIKLGLDKQLNKTGSDALSKAEKIAVNNVKTRLIGWLEKKNPEYKLAREQYALDSLPVNRMQVGNELKNKLITSLEKDSPATFASAVKDSYKVLAKATGEPRFKELGDILTGEEVKGVKKIVSELANESRAKKMAAESKSIIGNITGEVSLNLPHLLSRPIVITNHLLSILGKDKTPEYKKILVDMVKSPDKFLSYYGGDSASTKTRAAMDIIKRLNIMIGSQESAKRIGGAE